MKSAVEFYIPDNIISLKPQTQHLKWGKLGEVNTNDIYSGKRVMVVGSHEFKGYKGFVKSTTIDGYALVELDSRLQKTVPVKLSDLASL